MLVRNFPIFLKVACFMCNCEQFDVFPAIFLELGRVGHNLAKNCVLTF